MTCRRPTLADTHAIATAHVLAWQTAYAGIMPREFLESLTVASSEEQWEKWLSASVEPIRVVEAEHRVVGFAFFGASRDSDASKELAEIRAINLHPDYWRRGLGSQLLAESLATLDRDGFSEGSLWVLSANRPARRFYEVLGWRPDGASKLEAPDGCPPLDHVRYRIGLGTPR